MTCFKHNLLYAYQLLKKHIQHIIKQTVTTIDKNLTTSF